MKHTPQTGKRVSSGNRSRFAMGKKTKRLSHPGSTGDKVATWYPDRVKKVVSDDWLDHSI